MQTSKEIKVGFCIAYDWHLLKYSLPLIYKNADKICLSIDSSYTSWSGNRYHFNEIEFNDFIQSIDIESKIIIYRDKFYVDGQEPMKNETRQRNLMSSCLGEGGWHIQLDSDELFFNFEIFIKHLRKRKFDLKVNIVCPWITIYKQTISGLFYISPRRFTDVEFIQIATNNPKYDYGRRNGLFNIYVKLPVLHLSWARSELELRQKLENWGHSKDISVNDIENALSKWRNLSVDNYESYTNIHFLKPEIWPRLGFLSCHNFSDDFTLNNKLQLPISRIRLVFLNSLTWSRLVSLFRKILH